MSEWAATLKANQFLYTSAYQGIMWLALQGTH